MHLLLLPLLAIIDLWDHLRFNLISVVCSALLVFLSTVYFLSAMNLFNPKSSLSAMIATHYKLRGNIVSYNLGGTGCSVGLMSIDLAKNLLQVYLNSCVLVVSMENITLNSFV